MRFVAAADADEARPRAETAARSMQRRVKGDDDDDEAAAADKVIPLFAEDGRVCVIVSHEATKARDDAATLLRFKLCCLGIDIADCRPLLGPWGVEGGTGGAVR